MRRPYGVSAANERLRRQHRIAVIVAIVIAAAVHAWLFLLSPSFGIFSDARRTRMVVVLGEWQSPPAATASATLAGIPSLVPYDTAMPRPVLANHGIVQHRVPRIYPYHLWKHREPASALVQVVITPGGRVRDVALLSATDPGTDEAIVQLVRLMRFGAPGPTGVVGVVEVGVTPP